MGVLFFLLWLLIAGPGLPVSIPTVIYLFPGNKHGGSGALGAAMLITGVCGIVGWLIIAAFFLGRALAGA